MCGFLRGKPHAVRWRPQSSPGNPGSVYINCETALTLQEISFRRAQTVCQNKASPVFFAHPREKETVQNGPHACSFRSIEQVLIRSRANTADTADKVGRGVPNSNRRGKDPQRRHLQVVPSVTGKGEKRGPFYMLEAET
jgi:hypothetical protein